MHHVVREHARLIAGVEPDGDPTPMQWRPFGLAWVDELGGPEPRTFLW